jgi:hypothetical protein
MRKTIRATLPCPHCGQPIKFRERRVIVDGKVRWRVSMARCPHSDCQKEFSVKVGARKIKLSKRAPKDLKLIGSLLGPQER